jgi:hypothetical protein
VRKVVIKLATSLVDIHIKVDAADLERLKKFCLHRGDLTFLVGLSIKYYVKRLEEQTEREDMRLLHNIEV